MFCLLSDLENLHIFTFEKLEAFDFLRKYFFYDWLFIKIVANKFFSFDYQLINFRLDMLVKDTFHNFLIYMFCALMIIILAELKNISAVP